MPECETVDRDWGISRDAGKGNMKFTIFLFSMAGFGINVGIFVGHITSSVPYPDAGQLAAMWLFLAALAMAKR